MWGVVEWGGGAGEGGGKGVEGGMYVCGALLLDNLAPTTLNTRHATAPKSDLSFLKTCLLADIVRLP